MRHIVIASLALSCASCVIDFPLGALGPAPIPNLPTPPNGPIDVLIVVDNSGSMQEEQAVLARSFFKPECPIQDLTNVPEQLLNPPPEQVKELSEVCGFTQMLAAFDRDFRVGVITTDVNACDNTFPDAQAKQAGFNDWGFRPQRGCLHPVPSTGQRFLTRAGLQENGTFTELNDILANIQTFGAPVERGLDAADFFLAGDTFTEECAEDAASFIRREAQLLLVFLTDEDDCSHGDGLNGWPDETSTVCGENIDYFISLDAERCYQEADALVGIEHYAERFRALKGTGREQDVKMLVIGGAVEVLEDQFVPGGCYPDVESGGTASDCFESHGVSNITGPGATCADDTADQRGGLPCCTADGGNRYGDLAVTLGGHIDTICRSDFTHPIMLALE